LGAVGGYVRNVPWDAGRRIGLPLRAGTPTSRPGASLAPQASREVPGPPHPCGSPPGGCRRAQEPPPARRWHVAEALELGPKAKPRLDQRSTSGAFRGLAKGAVPHAAPLAMNGTRSRVDQSQRAVRGRDVLPRPVSPVDKELPERISDGRAKTAGHGSRATRKPKSELR
jgi:hypothetical protein